MKQAAVSPFCSLQCDAMPTPRGLLRMLLVTLCMSLALPSAAMAQTTAPALLPPAAQEAIDKGIIAAKVPDYLLAIRYFQEARKLAPQAPVIYLYMGLAESRIPSRELRAIAWFGAYLAAYPDAPNAAAVKEQMAVLEVRNQSNVLRLIKTVQDAANQISSQDEANKKISGQNEGVMVSKSPAKVYQMPQLWLKVGDIASAQKAVDIIQYAEGKNSAQLAIVRAQVKTGDIAGAQETADLIPQGAGDKSSAQSAIAEAQAKAGDITGAQKTVDLIQIAHYKKSPQLDIARAQAKAGDITGAKKTVDLLDSFHKGLAQSAIAEAQAKAGDIAGAKKTVDIIQDATYKKWAQEAIAKAQAAMNSAPNSTRQSTSDIPSKPQLAITASDFLKKLDDSDKKNDCPLNTERFLDLAGYLKSLPPPDYPDLVFVWGAAGRVGPLPRSGDSRRVLESLYETAEKIVKAHNVITGMLKRQIRK